VVFKAFEVRNGIFYITLIACNLGLNLV
jgi:hypothetical protein